MEKRILRIGLILIITGMIFSGCGNDPDISSFTGIIEGETHTLSSPVSDRLVELKVSEGDWVAKGAILGNIDATSLNLQLKGLHTSLDQIHLQEKDLEINLEQIGETFDHYNTMYQKNLALLKQEAVSDQTVRDLKLLVDKWNRDSRSVEIRLQLLKSQQENLQYQIAQVEDTLSKTILTASSDGYIDKIYFERNEFIPPMRPVIDLVNLDNVWCHIYVSESALTEITPGDPVKAEISNHAFTGKISHINSRAEFSPKEILSPDNRKALVYAVKISFENPDRILKIGMPINVYLQDDSND
ncbi:MAG: efflux RND transporter periplasmic adaptor subunit [Spirochaetales bacterium]|nr:efflux RND transporter periplasmic adaptor subunit [Spirochaetales bacterium]